jgi:hypothetical protein
MIMVLVPLRLIYPLKTVTVVLVTMITVIHIAMGPVLLSRLVDLLFKVVVVAVLAVQLWLLNHVIPALATRAILTTMRRTQGLTRIALPSYTVIHSSRAACKRFWHVLRALGPEPTSLPSIYHLSFLLFNH